ncbi:hypothetical protein evm_000621 [Chilo suppressalis]|nr:hypothetical protein evm_000621 [Chilo suppressalis]
MASQRRCCVPNCNVTRADKIQMHSFPNPDIHPDRLRTWLPLTLSPHAVPTLNLPGFGTPRNVLTDVTNRMDIDQGIEYSHLSMPSTSTSEYLFNYLQIIYYITDILVEWNVHWLSMPTVKFWVRIMVGPNASIQISDIQNSKKFPLFSFVFLIFFFAGGALTEKVVELQQKAVKKSKILSKISLPHQQWIKV